MICKSRSSKLAQDFIFDGIELSSILRSNEKCYEIFPPAEPQTTPNARRAARGGFFSLHNRRTRVQQNSFVRFENNKKKNHTTIDDRFRYTISIESENPVVDTIIQQFYVPTRNKRAAIRFLRVLSRGLVAEPRTSFYVLSKEISLRTRSSLEVGAHKTARPQCDFRAASPGWPFTGGR